jgi:hypothetical protein
MANPEDQGLSAFTEVRPVDNRILALGGGVNLLLLIGTLAAFSADHTILGLLLTLALLGSAAFMAINVRHWKGLFAAGDHRSVLWDIAIPEIQRAKLSEEVLDLSKTLGIPIEQVSDLLSAYVVAEDLALRQIQQETRLPLARHITIGKTPFDAIFARQDVITCVEVTFLVSSNLPQAKINVILNKLATAQKFLSGTGVKARLRLLLVLVTQMDRVAEAELRSTLAQKFTATPVDVDIRLLDFESLQKVFALE